MCLLNIASYQEIPDPSNLKTEMPYWQFVSPFGALCIFFSTYDYVFYIIWHIIILSLILNKM